MATATTTYADRSAAGSPRRQLLRRMIGGAAVFDTAMGAVCLAAGATLGDWLGISTAAVRGTGGVFLLAGLVGLATLRRTTFDVRWIAAANVVFALWCLGAVAVDSPNGIGIALLIVSAVAAFGTAAAEIRLAADA